MKTNRANLLNVSPFLGGRSACLLISGGVCCGLLIIAIMIIILVITFTKFPTGPDSGVSDYNLQVKSKIKDLRSGGWMVGMEPVQNLVQNS
jgi:mannose/fructose/N-acetylgalactosamine-specific phosphotransferase system component IID